MIITYEQLSKIKRTHITINSVRSDSDHVGYRGWKWIRVHYKWGSPFYILAFYRRVIGVLFKKNWFVCLQNGVFQRRDIIGMETTILNYGDLIDLTHNMLVFHPNEQIRSRMTTKILREMAMIVWEKCTDFPIIVSEDIDVDVDVDVDNISSSPATST